MTDFIFGRTIASNKIPDLFAGKLLTTAWNLVANFTFDTFCPELEPLEHIAGDLGSLIGAVSEYRTSQPLRGRLD